MDSGLIFRISFFLFIMMFALSLSSQDNYQWEFIKEKGGVRIYLSDETGSSLKAYKGETTVEASPGKVLELLTDADNFDWWDESISEIRVLDSRKGEYLRYYLVYDTPWPVTDRDLCVEALIIKDEATGGWIVSSKSLPGLVPEKATLVRMTTYWQRWSIVPLENERVRLVMEGFADPAGSIPAWLTNMVITDTPMKVLLKVRDRLQ